MVMTDKPSLDDLAAHISAILAHPDTPDSLYNAIAEELLELSDNARATADAGKDKEQARRKQAHGNSELRAATDARADG